MTMIQPWQSGGLFVLAALAFATLAQAREREADPLWGTHLDLEGKFGSQRSLGEADFFLPLDQDGRSLTFANLRGRFDDHSSREFNLGLGWRRMQASGWNLGAYGYFDRRRSNHGNTFNQATLGAEALGPDWDWRANLYLPLGDRVQGVGSDSSASLSGASIQVVTTTREERAIKGFDLEAGWRTPLFGRDDARQLRLYFGGYRFADDKVMVAGPRVRAELALEELPALWKGAKLFFSAEAQYDSPRGSQGFVGLRLRIPLDKASRHGQLSAQARRMTAPVVRDVDIVTQSRVAATLVETASQLANGTAVTVISSATTTGANLATAVTNAGNDSTVILSGNFDTAASIVSLAPGQTLMAGATEVRTASGRLATLTTSATIAGTNVNYAVVVHAGGTLSGLTVTNAHSGGGTGGYAVLVADGAGNATIEHNTLTATQSNPNAAVALGFGNNTSGIVRGNTLTVTGSGAATTMTALAMNSTTTVTVSDNDMSASGGALNYLVWVGGGTTINAGSTGNVRGSGTCNGAPDSGFLGFTDGTTCPP